MLVLRTLFYLLLTLPIKLLVRCKIIPENINRDQIVKSEQPIFYVVHHQSASDLLTLQKACKQLGLPDPLSNVVINGEKLARTFCLEKPTRLIPWRVKSKTQAISLGSKVLKQHLKDENLDAQLIPVNINWGRMPTKEKNNANVGTLLADQESPNWLRKFFIVLFLGRHSLVRFSDPMSFRYMTDQHGSNLSAAKKLMRIARFHFHRQTIAATGPRLMDRQQVYTALFANPSIRRLIEDEVKTKGQSKFEIKRQALKIMKEISGDYRDATIRFGDRILSWLWKRLYNGIEVHNAKRLRDLAQEGHEIIYVPCHRSHMDYLLLTHVIYQQGLVPPRIAAGINLSFWPAGPIFRKAGAFFIRRSFKGNRLYSTIFREYLGLLFERGYAVKYYTEGGRSRTGRLLAPKTGMLAMTIQSLLRGIDRPLTLVPVYIGYEHVMEVGTYYKELSGSEKKSESILGVVKAIKSLRNYGKGYVNFGEPININQFLNNNIDNWKEAIDPIEPQKPKWLTPSVNQLADQIMTHINQSVTLNAVSLIALILHATDNKAMPRSELEELLDFFIELQRLAPYSEQMTIPESSGKELLDHAISLNKLTVNSDSFGEIISLENKAILEMRYYRNNILHSFMLPALVSKILCYKIKATEEEIIAQVTSIMSLIRAEFFLWQNKEDIAVQVKAILTALEKLNTAHVTKANYWSKETCPEQQIKLTLLSEVADETLQRLAIVASLLKRLAPISKPDLEEKVVTIAKRLSVLNNIKAPEFIDKKAISALINKLKELEYISNDEQGNLVDNSTLETARIAVTSLVDIEVLQSIAR